METRFGSRRPVDQKTEKKFDLESHLAEQKILSEQHHDFYRRYKELISKNYENKRIELKGDKPGEPSEQDIKWHLLLDESVKNVTEGNMAMYRDVVLCQAGLLLEMGVKKDSLTMLLEVCYLDMNGPVNTSGLLFDPSKGGLSPGVLDMIAMSNSELHLTKKEIRARFMENSKCLPAPRSPELAWEILENQMRSEGIF
jgi:hypothetical protein